MKNSKRLWHELVKEIVAFFQLIAFVVLLWMHNLVLFTVVLVEGLTLLIFWHDRYDVGFFLIIGTLGSLAEAIFVNFGVWTYAHPSFLGIPLWFPVAFGTSALIGERLVRTIIELLAANRIFGMKAP